MWTCLARIGLPEVMVKMAKNDILETSPVSLRVVVRVGIEEKCGQLAQGIVLSFIVLITISILEATARYLGFILGISKSIEPQYSVKHIVTYTLLSSDPPQEGPQEKGSGTESHHIGQYS